MVNLRNLLMFKSPAKIFRYFLVCFIGGVTLASFVGLDHFWTYFFALICLIISILFWRNKFWRFLFLGGIIITLGIFRYQLSLPKIDESKIWFYNSQRLDFQGIVGAEPDIRINHTKLTIEAIGVIKGKVLVNVSLYPEYQYGDLVTINCKLESPEPFSGFAYDRYLAKDGIYSQCSYPKVKLVSRNNGDWLLTEIFQFKNKLRSVINSNLPEPLASLFFAINFGSRGGIPDDLSDRFNLTGTTHLMAISGMNITIIAAILMQLGLACYVSRKKAFWLATLVLVFYVLMIGFPASAVRALIMGWLAMLALYLGRLNQATNALIFAASLMILINPKVLRDDVGFQLSFLAVLGLIHFYPFFENWFKKLPAIFGFRESLAMTLAAQAATLPLTISSFGRLSLIGPIANLFAVPVLPYLVMIGFAAIFLSLIIPILAQYFFWPIWLILTYLIKVIELFSLIPLAAITL